MKLYWHPQTRSFRIVWLLEESGLAYERVRIDIRDPTAKADATFRAASPMGKVPALVDGPARLCDSGAIAIYLADQYPETRLGPPVGDPDRGAFLQWVTFTNGVIEPAMVERFQKLTPNPGAHGYGSFDLMLETLAHGIEARGGPWVLGERFTAADVLLGTACGWLQKFELVGRHAVLEAYVERCTARAAWQRTQAIDAAG